MLLTPEEIKVVKDFLAPAVKNGLLDGRRLNELLKLAASGGESRPEVPEKLYTVKEAAELLSCHPKSIFRYIREGWLGVIKISARSTRIPRTALELFISVK